MWKTERRNWPPESQHGGLLPGGGGCVMFSTTASKFVASMFLVAVSASGLTGVDKRAPTIQEPHEVPVALASNSLMVATMANGEIQTQWMPRGTCERAEQAVAAGRAVAGIRSDGVSVFIAHANCSTPRVEVRPDAIALGPSEPGN
jgi:hypothetical protein